MSKPKYMKGDCIRSLDDLVLQENIFWNGRIWNRKWFMNLRNGGYMIDAKEIVQALRCCKFGVPCEKCPVVGNKDCFDEVNTAAAELIERLTAENAKAEAERDALREKKRWISVTEKTPEYDMPQLALNADGEALIANYAYGEWFDTWGQDVEVTHWMPLPEAPEEGDKA
mgnify:CR=1 FL=1|jgi:hypothetical protein